MRLVAKTGRPDPPTLRGQGVAATSPASSGLTRSGAKKATEMGRHDLIFHPDSQDYAITKSCTGSGHPCKAKRNFQLCPMGGPGHTWHIECVSYGERPCEDREYHLMVKWNRRSKRYELQVDAYLRYETLMVDLREFRKLASLDAYLRHEYGWAYAPASVTSRCGAYTGVRGRKRAGFARVRVHH